MTIRRGLPDPLPLDELPLDPLGVAPEADTPFLRSRIRARVKRSRKGLLGKLALFLQLAAVLVAGATGLWVGYAKVMASERFKVERIEVTGSHFLSKDQVKGLLGKTVGENILGVDLEALQRRIRLSPWVADAAVRRTLPDTLEVEIQERVPLALVELDRLYLMDAEGSPIDVYGEKTSQFDLPIVRGLQGLSAEDRRGRAYRAGALLADLRELASEVSELGVEDEFTIRLVLRGAGEVVLMGEAPYYPRFRTFLSLRKDLRAKCPDADYFDLRFQDRIYAKEAELPSAPKGR